MDVVGHLTHQVKQTNDQYVCIIGPKTSHYKHSILKYIGLENLDRFLR